MSRPEVMDEDAPEEPDHLTVSRSLVSTLASPLVHVFAVQPGTYKALQAYPRLSKEEGRPIDLLHLDVHGVIKRGMV